MTYTDIEYASCAISRLGKAVPLTTHGDAYGFDVVGEVGTEGVLLTIGVVHPMLDACGSTKTRI